MERRARSPLLAQAERYPCRRFMESIEQELMGMLRRLPVPITITWRSGLYHWQCEQASGSAHGLVAAAEDALQYLLKHPGILLRTQEHRES